MAGDITCIASSSSSSNSHVYEVFLNHRGPDQKKRLASHIYRRLIVRGLNVFLDQPELEKGEDIPPQIKEAIRTASVHVALFSPTYAQSTWCLEELALMVESKSTIIPVFIGVDPSELRWTRGGDGEFAGVQGIIRCIYPCLLGEKGRYARDLEMLQKKTTSDPLTNKKKPRHDSTTLERWRKALSVVSNKSGFVMDGYDGDEGLLVDAVVEKVWRKVGKTPLEVAKYPTGLAEKIEDVERMVLLQQQTQKSRVVGIVGLGGVGKSTLAREFYNRYRSNYDRHCFLSDVRETAARKSLSSLQATLLRDLADLNHEQISNLYEGIGMLRKHLSSSPSSLIVLDDVDHIDQLDALLSPVKDTIQSGCLILVTSRNRDLLTSSGIVEASIYKQTGLNRQHSKELFCWYAFDQSFPNEGFEQLVEDFLDFCGGFPLSLKLNGSAIRGKDSEFWKSYLHRISRKLPTDIRSMLQISYDGLNVEEQNIFLDIACFLIGENIDTAITIWKASGWAALRGLRNLKDRCLIEVDSEDCIRMQDHVRDMGRDVAEKELPGYQLRLWRPNVNLLRTLSRLWHFQVRGISMDYGNGREQFLEQFLENVAANCNLSSLKLLRGQGSFVERVFSAGELRQLIYLRWEECPISSLYFTNLTRNLSVLYIEGQNLKTLWQHESQAPLQLRELYIDAPLSEVPESIGKLNRLEKIVLEKSVFKTLPNVFHQMHCLKYIGLKSCREMMLLPDSVGILTALQTLDLYGCSGLQGLQDSVGQLTGLQRINLEGCSSLQGLPDWVGQLTGLQSINLGGCSSLQGLPDSVGQLTSLQRLYLSGCSNLQRLPNSVGQLNGLQRLYLNGCSNLQGIPDSVGELKKLEYIDLSTCSRLQILPNSFGDLTTLHRIDLSQCWNLKKLPSALGNLTNLHHIDLSQCSNLMLLPDSFGNLTSLHHIDLSQCSNLMRLPDSFENLKNLHHIDLSQCSNLMLLPDSFENLTNLHHIDLSQCSNLKLLPDSFRNLTNLHHIDLSQCSNMKMLPEYFANFCNVEYFNLSRWSNLHVLPDYTANFKKLKYIDLSWCSNLRLLPDSFGELRNLGHANLSGCINLETFPQGDWERDESLTYSLV